MKIRIVFCAVSICSLLLSGCYRSDRANSADRNDNVLKGGGTGLEWDPDTEKLDLCCKYDVGCSNLDSEVKHFYELLRDKSWKQTYEFRSQGFRDSVSEQSYLNDVEHEIPDWRLVNYSILSVNEIKGPNSDQVDLICKFVEMPGMTTTYSVVTWRKEKDGVWRCNSAGPNKIVLLRIAI